MHPIKLNDQDVMITAISYSLFIPSIIILLLSRHCLMDIAINFRVKRMKRMKEFAKTLAT